jgi:hypothetical protein
METYMKMSRESFFQALLKQNSDELLIKAQALARQWDERISCQMEGHEYHAINNEKTTFLTWEGFDDIVHGLFVDDKMHSIAYLNIQENAGSIFQIKGSAF